MFCVEDVGCRVKSVGCRVEGWRPGRRRLSGPRRSVVVFRFRFRVWGLGFWEQSTLLFDVLGGSFANNHVKTTLVIFLPSSYNIFFDFKRRK